MEVKYTDGPYKGEIIKIEPNGLIFNALNKDGEYQIEVSDASKRIIR